MGFAAKPSTTWVNNQQGNPIKNKTNHAYPTRKPHKTKTNHTYPTRNPIKNANLTMLTQQGNPISKYSGKKKLSFWTWVGLNFNSLLCQKRCYLALPKSDMCNPELWHISKGPSNGTVNLVTSADLCPASTERTWNCRFRALVTTCANLNLSSVMTRAPVRRAHCQQKSCKNSEVRFPQHTENP